MSVDRSLALSAATFIGNSADASDFKDIFFNT